MFTWAYTASLTLNCWKHFPCEQFIERERERETIRVSYEDVNRFHRLACGLSSLKRATCELKCISWFASCGDFTFCFHFWRIFFKKSEWEKKWGSHNENVYFNKHLHLQPLLCVAKGVVITKGMSSIIILIKNTFRLPVSLFSFRPLLPSARYVLNNLPVMTIWLWLVQKEFPWTC